MHRRIPDRYPKFWSPDEASAAQNPLRQPTSYRCEMPVASVPGTSPKPDLECRSGHRVPTSCSCKRVSSLPLVRTWRNLHSSGNRGKRPYFLEPSQKGNPVPCRLHQPPPTRHPTHGNSSQGPLEEKVFVLLANTLPYYMKKQNSPIRVFSRVQCPRRVLGTPNPEVSPRMLYQLITAGFLASMNCSNTPFEQLAQSQDKQNGRPAVAGRPLLFFYFLHLAHTDWMAAMAY